MPLRLSASSAPGPARGGVELTSVNRSSAGDYDDLPDGVVVVGPDRTVVAVNVAAERLLGTAADALVGLPLAEALPFADEQGRSWWACTDPYDGLATRSRQPERQLMLIGGPAAGRSLLVTASYIREGRTVVRVVVLLRDNGARERSERSRANLVSTVAHELRSPLTSVKGFTATLLARWDRFNDEQKKVMLQTVNADADRVTRLITDLLDVSRIDAGRLQMHKQVVDLTALVDKVVAGRVAAGEESARFRVQITGRLPEIWADPDKVLQILGNLVENALRHGEGSVTVTVGPHNDGAQVTVADEG
ncbi:MAG TPA: PAS domain-containing sensor histidine kinase, partial [Mycobacteriales bacterium]|nr:PAS domain-containing sensor histidine kinase [Mycobacteriales bacterium]